MENSFCESFPCNTGVCQPDFELDRGHCKCSGYSGEFCQTLDPLNTEDVGHWTFDSGYMENVGTGASNLGDGTMTTGVIVETLERSTKVMHCKGGGSGYENCFSIFPDFSKGCWSSQSSFVTSLSALPTACPNGFTLAFWVRALYPRNIDVETGYAVLVSQGFRSTQQGFSIWFGKKISIEFHTNTDYAFCQLNQFKDKQFKEWMLFGLTYNSHDGKFHCIFNNELFEASVGVHTQADLNAFYFGGTTPTFFDDVIYLPSHLTNEGLHVVYNQTNH
ncbi:uncharacterized protein [Clytia hemisphaerica]|uniref:uncharacterized protein isoform X2 n=1 Tax=Clytia hemisphaerica TaxID=252671 RepID=UPI0034D6AED2